MKKKKSLIFIIISVVLIVLIGVFIFNLLHDKNKLTVTERHWINDNINTIQNVNVVNDVNVFGKNGRGVFYDFIDDFEAKYNLTVNPITYNATDVPSGITFAVKTSLKEDDTVFYTDHYVLVSKKYEVLSKEENLNGKTVGIINNSLNYISNYIKKANISFSQFENKDDLLKALASEEEGKVDYIIVPLMEYLDVILGNNYHIVYHFSDIKINFVLQTEDSTLSNVLKKFYNEWKSNFAKTYDKELFNSFIESLNISATEVDSMQSISYNYGFVNASPYEVITGGKYGGIVAVILSKFSDFADVDFNFSKYSNFKKFENAIKDEKIDLYFNYYNFVDNYNSTNGLAIPYTIVASKDNDSIIKSVYSLIGEEVYVQENSKLYDFVKNINGINVKTFETTKELFKLNKKDVYILLDSNSFDYYQNGKLDNYTRRYTDTLKDEYVFKVRTNSVLYKLLDKYIEVLDHDKIILEGLLNHHETVKNGGVITKFAEYILSGIVIVIILTLIIIKKSKRITIAKKIKKEDKMKFIDQLTSLKNRNYLNENIENWNNNTIYPQTIIVIDLNKVQEINDLHGYLEGDKQIKALANILVKTQLDNSEIMRTDGNEFVIYLVGASQKQISNYIHKLNKEIKKLPYDFGAEFGYSMIEDDIKTIEDAMNEAVEDMKKQKESKND